MFFAFFQDLRSNLCNYTPKTLDYHTGNNDLQNVVENLHEHINEAKLFIGDAVSLYREKVPRFD